MTAVCDLLFDLCNSDASRYEKAGRDRRDRHHNRVCQEIEEVKELHSDHGHTGQWTIAKTGERSEQEHNDSHKYRRLFPAPVQLILKSGDGTLGQGDGTCDSREQDQDKKQDTDCGSESHACEHLRDRDEHQRRTGLQGIRVTAGEGEDGRDDHETGHDRDRGIEDLNILGGIFDRSIFFHVGTEGDKDSHGDGQGVEHLSHSGYHRHP